MCKSSLIKVVADNFATVTQGENTHNWLGPSTQLLPHYLSHFSQLQRILPPGAHFFSSLKCGGKVSSCQSFIEMRLAFGRSSILSGEVGLTQCQSEQVFVAWDCDPSADTGKKRGVRKYGFLRAQCGHPVQASEGRPGFQSAVCQSVAHGPPTSSSPGCCL